MSVPKRLYFDLECSPNIGMFWTAGYKQTIDYSNIIKERAIICICYKWEGQKKTHSLVWDSKQSDRKLLIDFIAVAKDADELVGHNGDKFDLAWIRTRCLFHRITMFPSYRTIDTLKIARSKFRFNSNRLNYIADFLGIGTKIKVDFGLWKDILLNNNPSSLKKMVTYCKKDVVLLERVFYELSPHVESKVHHGVLNGGERGSCPQCGSLDLVKQRMRATESGLLKIIYKCNGCGKYHTRTALKGTKVIKEQWV